MDGTILRSLALYSWHIAIQFWTWALKRGITLKACHTASLDNQTANKMTRLTVTPLM